MIALPRQLLPIFYVAVHTPHNRQLLLHQLHMPLVSAEKNVCGDVYRLSPNELLARHFNLLDHEIIATRNKL